MPASDPDFAVVTTHLPSGALEVLVVGELDLASCPQLTDTVAGQLADGSGDIRVVLNAVTFVDSTGALCLVDLAERAAARGRRFRLVAPSAPVRAVLEMTGLVDAFQIE